MPNEIQERLAENIKRLRKAQKLTQFELAEKADISEAMVKSVELCHSWPSEKTLLQISKALDADVHQFFLPAECSVSMKSTLRCEIQSVIKKKYCEFVQEVLGQLE